MEKLQDKAMLVRLSISQWTARKYDRKISAEVAANHGTSTDAGRYNKMLIARAEIKKISKITNEARTWHYDNTLPWGDAGERILPAANYMPYSQKMRGYRVKFDAAVCDFCDNYPALVQDARYNLNGLFNPADYPPVNAIHNKYIFSVDISPIPAGCDFRVSLQRDEITRIREKIKSRIKQATETALADLWDRLYQSVSRMADRLDDTDKVFRDSLVNNLCSLTELLPRLNVTDNPDLETMRREIEGKLCQTSPAALRTDTTARKKTAREAKNIMDTMAGYMGVTS